ncbi:MAG: RNA pseudouridine synthase, partial [Oscillospiraceae bacterium]|nr:RNA pseudouridine synthase [Oscillospiraceae bacterium]
PRPTEGRLEGYIFKDAKKNQVYVKDKMQPGAKLSVTEYRLLQTKNHLSLVECTLLTGRTHQIRAQMAHAGWPLLGDGKYGSERENKKFDETSGQALYSYKLRFDFPTDAGILEYLRDKEFEVEKIDFVEKYFE